MNIRTRPFSQSGSIRRLGPDDAISSANLARVTDGLELRQSEVIKTLNGLIQELVNLDVAVPITCPAVSVAALESIQLSNLRIPKGYQASVLNASVASQPAAGSAVLRIVHSAGTFGMTGAGSGTTLLVETTTELALAGSYVGEGELIVRVSNTSSSRISATVSVLVVLKPV